MIRTQIQITREQARHLRSIARRDEVSMAEVIRRCIDDRLRNEPELARRYEQARNFVGVDDGPEAPTDLAANHDRYLDEAFDAGS